MSRIPRLTAEQRADLVAYLDGELEEEQSRVIEQTLSASEVARHEVAMLGRTWDLLDALPRETASAAFTAKTLASVRVETIPVRSPWRPYILQAMTGLGWITALTAAGLIGFSVGHRWVPQPSDPIVRDFQLIERLDAYRDAGTADFLRELSRHDLSRPSGEGPR